MNTSHDLTKREKRKLHKQEKQARRAQTLKKLRIRKISISIVVTISMLVLAYWVIVVINTVKYDETVDSFPSQGQEHITNGYRHPQYNSNPPTSGWHYTTAANAGFYDKPIPDETLIHNLEHGHVVISYNCKIAASKTSLGIVPIAYAHSGHSTENKTEHIINTTLPNNFNDASCDRLKKQLKSIVKKYNSWKIIAVPRSANDVRIALTAWTKLEKLSSFDKRAINAFIKTYRNKGPENTSK